MISVAAVDVDRIGGVIPAVCHFIYIIRTVLLINRISTEQRMPIATLITSVALRSSL